MSIFLKNYYLAEQDKVYLGHETHLIGDALNHLPAKGNVTMISDLYKPENFELPYARYYKTIFGEPSSFRIIPQNSFEINGQEMFLTGTYNPTSCDMAGNVQLNANKEVFEKLNNKYLFQQEVIKVLGSSFSTKPKILAKGMDLNEVFKSIELELKDKPAVIVKICNPEYVLIGAALGVVLVNISNFKIEVLRILEKHGAIEDMIIKADLVIEEYYDSDFSPSVTFFIDNVGVSMLSSNVQFLNNRRYQGATNIWPEDLEIVAIRRKIEDLGQTMALHCQKIGARGFLGFDLLIKVESSEIKVVECNYRSGGASNPQLMTQRIAEFKLDSDWANWMLLQRILYKPKCKNFEEMEQILESEKVLFKGGMDLDRVLFMPLNALGDERFHLLCFWPKTIGVSEDDFELIQNIWARLGDDRLLIKTGTKKVLTVDGYR